MPTELEEWKGAFGDEYTSRNAVEWRSRLEGFRSMFEGLSPKRVLEVGCNRGHNLVGLAELLDSEVELAGIEPNRTALQIARRSTDRAGFLPGTIYDLPFKDGYFDLVFTCGVLIHIPDEKLQAALAEMARVSSRYILFAEYFAEQDEEIVYRGQSGLLWKRDFSRHMLKAAEGLIVARYGYLGPEQGFDRTHWWLMEKSASVTSA
jgi:pseudaminic acid biosynthesis-associated methylase